MASVLIIDDDEDVTRLLETHLTEEGHTVTVAHDGRSGMDQLLKNIPDLIMLDVFLPDATGYQICNRIRKNDATKTTPIILMTGAARFPNQQLYGQQRGANEYIFKPFDIVQVGELVHKYIVPGVKNPVKAAPTADLAALNDFLKRKTSEVVEEPAAAVMDEPPELEIEPPSNPLIAFSRVTIEPQPSMNGNGFHAVEPDPIPARPAPDRMIIPAEMPVPAPMPQREEHLEPAQPAISREPFEPAFIGSQEQVIRFGIEIFNLATRLCSSPSEKFLGDQLLRSSLSVGAKLNAAQFSTSQSEYSSLILSALRDLRESAYWLMLTRKAGLLESLAKTELEKTCQALIQALTEFASDKNR